MSDIRHDKSVFGPACHQREAPPQGGLGRGLGRLDPRRALTGGWGCARLTKDIPLTAIVIELSQNQHYFTRLEGEV